MILGLFAFLTGISITLILLGLFNRENSGFALVGFGLLFILSLIILNGNLETEHGATANTLISYDGSGNINGTSQNIEYSYQNWNDTTSHQVGFWLAVISVIGFIILLFAIRRGSKDE